MANDELLRAAEVGQLLGISTWSVWDLARKGLIPVVRIGRRVRFRRKSVERWLEQNEGQWAEGR